MWDFHHPTRTISDEPYLDDLNILEVVWFQVLFMIIMNQKTMFGVASKILSGLVKILGSCIEL